jgi:hypothetical protein
MHSEHDTGDAAGKGVSKEPRTGVAMLHPIVEGLHHPVVRVLALVLAVIGGTLAALKTGLVPRMLYMPEKDIALLDRSKIPVPEQSPSVDEKGVSIKITPRPERSPDDPIVIKKVTAQPAASICIATRPRVIT